MEEPEVPIESVQEDLHHRAEQHGERWTLGVALSCAILASLAAVASMSAGHYANEAMIAQIESANQWSYFQSKSIKEAQLKGKVEILEALGKTGSPADKAKSAEYAAEKAEIQKKAGETSAEARHFLHTHHTLARSVTMFQIAIAIAAISALTKKQRFWLVSLLFGVAGCVFLVLGFGH